MEKYNQLDARLITQIAEAQSIENAWKVLLPIVHRAGFSNLIYATNRLRGPRLFGEHSDSWMISDAPAPFLEQFWNQGLYRTTPVSAWVMQNTGPISLQYGSDLYHDGKLDRTAEESQSILIDEGTSSGYAIGYNRADSAVVSGFGLLNFGKCQSDADLDWQKYGIQLQAYCHIFHLRATSLPIPLKNKTLTKRQQEVLTWVGSGKTTAEVATILGLSTAAIEKHLKRVREILNVSTTTQAVLHAQINAQIFSIPRQ